MAQLLEGGWLGVGGGDSGSEEEEGSRQAGSLGWRCHQLSKIRFLAVFMVLSSAKHTVYPSVPYIVNTFFAQRHGGGDCALTPKSKPCQQGVADAALWHSASDGASHLVAMPVAIALGSLSDHFGRLPILRASVGLSVLVLLALAAHLQAGLSLWIYLIANPLVECFDCNGVFLAMFFDIPNIIPDRRERSAAWLMFGAVFVPLLIVSVITSHLVPASLAMWVSLAAGACQLTWLVWFFPETAKVHAGSQVVGARAVFGDAKRVLFRNGFILKMVAIVALTGFGMGGKSVIMGPLIMGRVGVSKSQKLLILLPVLPVALASFAASFWLSRRLGEVRVLKLGLLAATLFALAVVFCHEVWQLIVVFCLFLAPSFVSFVATVWIKSALVALDEQGTVQGLTTGVGKGAAVAGIMFFGWLLHASTEGGKDLEGGMFPPFFAMAGVEGLALLLASTLPLLVPSCDGVKGTPSQEKLVRSETSELSESSGSTASASSSE